MENSKEKKMTLLFLLATFILIISLTSYWTLNKEQITLIVEGKETKVSTFKKTVKDLLIENNIEYDSDDKITPGLNSKIIDYMDIAVVKVDIENRTEKVTVPFETTLIEDKELLKGKTEIEQEGIEGVKENTYQLIYEDGELVEKKLVQETVSQEPVDKIVKKGIKEDVIIASRGSSSRSGNSTYMKVVATAYAGDGITSTGTKPKWGTIAVDPRVIPYGTKVYIPQFNMTFTAEDCGGAIKGNKIDIFMMSDSECYNWGRRTIDVYILK
ncbi:MAG: 3D domain-containing protein [Peptostreptococcaceae bacterium]